MAYKGLTREYLFSQIEQKHSLHHGLCTTSKICTLAWDTMQQCLAGFWTGCGDSGDPVWSPHSKAWTVRANRPTATVRFSVSPLEVRGAFGQSRAEKRRVAVCVPMLWLGQQLFYEKLSHWDCGSLRKGQFIVVALLFIMVKIMLIFIRQTPYTPYSISEGPCVGRGWRIQLNWCFQSKHTHKCKFLAEKQF